MAFYTPTAPRPLTQEELDAIAAEDATLSAAPPPATAPPTGGGDQGTLAVAPPPPQAAPPPADAGAYEGSEVQPYETSAQAPAPVPQDPGATQTTVPTYLPSPPPAPTEGATATYGGDPGRTGGTPGVNSTEIKTSYPATGAPQAVRYVATPPEANTPVANTGNGSGPGNIGVTQTAPTALRALGATPVSGQHVSGGPVPTAADLATQQRIHSDRQKARYGTTSPATGAAPYAPADAPLRNIATDSLGGPLEGFHDNPMGISDAVLNLLPDGALKDFVTPKPDLPPGTVGLGDMAMIGTGPGGRAGFGSLARDAAEGDAALIAESRARGTTSAATAADATLDADVAAGRLTRADIASMTPAERAARGAARGVPTPPMSLEEINRARAAAGRPPLRQDVYDAQVRQRGSEAPVTPPTTSIPPAPTAGRYVPNTPKTVVGKKLPTPPRNVLRENPSSGSLTEQARASRVETPTPAEAQAADEARAIGGLNKPTGVQEGNVGGLKNARPPKTLGRSIAQPLAVGGAAAIAADVAGRLPSRDDVAAAWNRANDWNRDRQAAQPRILPGTKGPASQYVAAPVPEGAAPAMAAAPPPLQPVDTSSPTWPDPAPFRGSSWTPPTTGLGEPDFIRDANRWLAEHGIIGSPDDFKGVADAASGLVSRGTTIIPGQNGGASDRSLTSTPGGHYGTDWNLDGSAQADLAQMDTTALATALTTAPRNAHTIDTSQGWPILHLVNADGSLGAPIGYDDGTGKMVIIGKEKSLTEFDDLVAAAKAGHPATASTTPTLPQSSSGNAEHPNVAPTAQPAAAAAQRSATTPGGGGGGGTPTSTTSGGGGSRRATYSGSQGSDSGSRDYPARSSKRGPSVGQLFANDGEEMSLADFTKDYNGNGEVDEEDRRTADKRYASWKKKRGRTTRKTTKGKTTTSTVPQRPDSPIRTKVLGAIKTSTSKR